MAEAPEFPDPVWPPRPDLLLPEEPLVAVRNGGGGGGGPKGVLILLFGLKIEKKPLVFYLIHSELP